MRNDSPAISPWTGPESDPIAAGRVDVPASAVVDSIHEMVVQVFAAAGPEKINVASGVLAGGGLVLTDLRALFVEAQSGGVQPATAIVVLTTKGVFPAHLVGGALDAGVAALELSEPARGLQGPPLAEGPLADHLLAVRASKEGAALVYEVIGLSLQPAEDASRLRSMPAVPVSFAGAPAFDTGGELAGLLVGPGPHGVVLVPAARLLQVLARVPADALPEAVQTPPSSSPEWLGRALAAWGGPSIPRPGRYDYRYTTW